MVDVLLCIGMKIKILSNLASTNYAKLLPMFIVLIVTEFDSAVNHQSKLIIVTLVGHFITKTFY